MNLLKTSMLTVAGADRELLAQAPHESTKQAALGGAVLTTAVLATVSASVAFAMAFDATPLVAGLGGLVWGTAILNLDRWLIVSTPRQVTARLTIAMAMPRLLLALVIGLVVSTPLTLQVFQDEIHAHLNLTQADRLAAFETRMQHDPRFASLGDDQAQIAVLQQTIASGAPADAVIDNPEVRDLRRQLAAVQQRYAAAEQAVTCEKEGSCGSGRTGAGPAAADKEAIRDGLAADRADLRRQLADTRARVAADVRQQSQTIVADAKGDLAGLQAEVTATEQARDRAVATHTAAVMADDGLLAQLGALHEMERTEPAMKSAHLGIFVFLTALECLPMLVKTLMSLGRPGAYEWLQQAEQQRVQDRVLLRHEVEYDEAQLLADAARSAARARAATQLDAEIRTAKAVLAAQVDLAGAAVEKWKQEQSAHLVDEVAHWLDTADVSVSTHQR